MWCTRSAGPLGSTGMYAAPARRTAKMPTTASTERDITVATRSPGPIPLLESPAATRRTRAVRSLNDTVSPLAVTAGLSGCSSAHRERRRSGRGDVSSVAGVELAARTSAVLFWDMRGTSRTCRSGCAEMSCKTVTRCSAKSVIVSRSNRSASYSTTPVSSPLVSMKSTLRSNKE